MTQMAKLNAKQANKINYKTVDDILTLINSCAREGKYSLKINDVILENMQDVEKELTELKYTVTCYTDIETISISW
jgi:thiamine pyrophosphokinase